MTALASFSNRSKWTKPDGTLTYEAQRFLSIFEQRVGGALGSVGSDTFSIDTFGVGDAAVMAEILMQAPSVGDATVTAEILMQAPGSDYLAPYEFQTADGGFLSDTTFQV